MSPIIIMPISVIIDLNMATLVDIPREFSHYIFRQIFRVELFEYRIIAYLRNIERTKGI